MAIIKYEDMELSHACKLLAQKYINDNPNFPGHIKKHISQNVFQTINIIPAYLATVELLWRREKDK